MEQLKYIATIIGAFIGGIIGGYDGFLYALVAMMVIDYISGVLVAINSKSWSSAIGSKGITKKVYILLMVIVGNIVDTRILGQGNAVRTSVIFFYFTNELGSIIENAARLGLPVPQKLVEVMIQLRNNEKKAGDIISSIDKECDENVRNEKIK